MPTYLSKLTLPVDISGTITATEFTIKDAEARQMIQDLGQALYWVGITTTALEDGSTTNPITVNSEPVTVDVGGIASYNDLEFIWNGSAWQQFGHADFGALAFVSTAEATYTPAGTIAITAGQDTTTNITPVTAVGTLPEWTYDSANENATFTAGTLPTQGTAVNVMTARGTDTAAFTGTQATITVAPASSNP